MITLTLIILLLIKLKNKNSSINLILDYIIMGMIVAFMIQCAIRYVAIAFPLILILSFVFITIELNR